MPTASRFSNTSQTYITMYDQVSLLTSKIRRSSQKETMKPMKLIILMR